MGARAEDVRSLTWRGGGVASSDMEGSWTGAVEDGTVAVFMIGGRNVLSDGVGVVGFVVSLRIADIYCQSCVLTFL